ncbi:hypothetical protein HZS_1883 [Henneguya salminicola]|nr:hypothetical protein HZS_1883 [Henneguya salminicola]
MQSIQRTENGISETNNKVEGRHNAFARLFSLQRELNLLDVKIGTIHMQTTKQNTRRKIHFTYGMTGQNSDNNAIRSNIIFVREEKLKIIVNLIYHRKYESYLAS